MKKPQFHFLVCNSFRVAGDSQGVCNKKGGTSLLHYLSEQVDDRGLDAVVSGTACLNVCTAGPAMVVYPHNQWYGNLSESAIDTILDALENGEVATDYLISD